MNIFPPRRTESGETAIDASRMQPPEAANIVCGPEQMMVQIKNDLKRIGFEPRSIHTETFGF